MRMNRVIVKLNLINEADKLVARAAQLNLTALNHYIENFGAALSLFEYSQQQLFFGQQGAPNNKMDEMRGMFSPWMFVASRDGAMSIYHFMNAMEGAKACLHRSAQLNSIVNRKALRVATKTFSSSFPNCEEMRHSIAHRAELTASPEALKDNAFTGEYEDDGIKISGDSSVSIGNYLNGSTYTTTINGKIISYNINRLSYSSLQAVRDLIYDALEEGEFISKSLF